MKITVTIPARTITIPSEVVEIEVPDCPQQPPIVVPPVVDPPIIVPPPSGKYTGDAAKLGTCAFHWVSLDKIKFFSTIRLYISSAWIWRPGGLFVEPMFSANKPQTSANGFDEYLSAAKAAGVDVLPCINQSPEWYRNGGIGKEATDFPPIKPGKNREDPASYADWAEFWFQFVARYGAVKHPDNELKVDSTPRWTNDSVNVKKSGLGLIKAVEIGNEYDRWWDKGTEKYVTPKEHAALLSACYDAVKRADPSMVVVMAGLTDLDASYIQEMEEWAAKNRPDKKFPADVLNVHHYSNSGNKSEKLPPTWDMSGACMPEVDQAWEPGFRALKIMQKLTGLPLWVTEYGADTVKGSQMHIKGVGMTDEEAQAELIVRTMLMHLAEGVQRSYVFTAINEPGNSGTFGSSGILTGETGTPPFAQKKSAYNVKLLISELDGYTFSQDMSDKFVKALIFTKPGAPDKAFYWAIGANANVVLFGRTYTATNFVKIVQKQ